MTYVTLLPKSITLRSTNGIVQPCLHVDFDIELLGECDVVVAELCKRAGWELKHEMIPPGQEVDVKLVDGYQSRYTFKAKVA